MTVLKRKPISLALSLLAFPYVGLAQSVENNAGDNAKVLEEVVVRDTYEREDLPALAPGRKAARGARLGILGATAITDAPVHVNAYTRELAEDWVAMSLQDVLENDPAVTFTTNKSHMLNNFNLRGIDMSAMDIATNGLYGIAPANSIPIELFERVEVMRGPNVLLSGMPPSSSVAGSVNMVTKRALNKPIADMTFSYGSQSFGQVHADVGQRFGEEKRLGIRVNGVYGNGKMGAKDEKQTRQVGGIAIDYLGDRARFSLDVYDSTHKISNGSPGMFNFTNSTTFGGVTVPGLGQVLSPPRGDVNLFRGTHGTYENSGYLARAEYDLTQDLQGYIALGASESEGKGLMFGTRSIVIATDGTTRGAIYNVHTRSERQTAEAGLIGKFETGSVKHRMQVSWNILKFKEGTNNIACNYCYTTNMYNPVTPTFPNPPVSPAYTVNNEFTSLALADTMSFADDKVLLTVGARQQRIKQPLAKYNADKLSPMVAAVVRPWGNDVSLFGNYTEGLEPGEVVGVGFANAGQTLAPKQTQQMELGVKLQTGKLTHTLSTFEIERPSYIGTAPAAKTDAGMQRLTGVEWSVFGQVTPTISVIGGITNIKSRLEHTAKESFGTPEWRARIGLDWNTPIHGLTTGGRLVYTSKQWLDSNNRLSLPSWTRFDLNAGYATNIAGKPVTFHGAIENVTNKNYWIGTFGDGFAMPGMPRTFRVSAKVSFL